jgi:hypothetical protein
MCWDYPIQKGLPCVDAPYPLTCCPSGFQCERGTAQFWSCQPSNAVLSLDVCKGPKTRVVGDSCGGSKLCGKDGMCGACCNAGLYCSRRSNLLWQCASVTQFKGGLLG